MPVSKKVNADFFKDWSSEMVYVLGFFVADGSMIKNRRGAYFIEFEITDKDLLEQIRRVLGSNHKISERKRNDNWKRSYRLQIGSKEIFNDLTRLGLFPAKSKVINLPDIPDKYFADFVRGYFDGDGCVVCGFYKKKNRIKGAQILRSNFVSGSKNFLTSLLANLKRLANIERGFICKKNRGFQLNLGFNDSKKLFVFMYKKGLRGLFLKRKYYKFYKGISESMLSAGVV